MAKPLRGRPPLGELARSVAKLIKLTPAEDAAWTAALGDGETIVGLVRSSVEREIKRRQRAG